MNIGRVLADLCVVGVRSHFLYAVKSLSAARQTSMDKLGR